MRIYLRNFILIMLYLLVGSSTEVRAQETLIETETVPYYVFEQDICPSDHSCGILWEVLPDSNLLYAFSRNDDQLYRINTVSGVIDQYDLAAYEGAIDYVPYSETSILLLNYHSLYLYDFVSGIETIYFPEYRFLSCNSDFTPPIDDLIHASQSNYVVACGQNPDKPDDRFIGVIDIAQDTLDIIVTFNDAAYPGRQQPWLRVTIAANGDVFAIIHGLVLNQLFPDREFYNEAGDVRAIEKWSKSTGDWSLIYVPFPIDQLGGAGYLGELFAADVNGNIYFAQRINEGIQIVQVDPFGNPSFVHPEGMSYWDTFPIGVMPSGQPIITTKTERDNTIGLQVFKLKIMPTSAVEVDVFGLYNPQSAALQTVLTDGAIIDFSRLDPSLLLTVQTTPITSLNDVHYSVIIELDGTEIIDNEAPFTLPLPSIGTHTLRAIPYAAQGGQVIAGTTRSITFTVIDSE